MCTVFSVGERLVVLYVLQKYMVLELLGRGDLRLFLRNVLAKYVLYAIVILLKYIHTHVHMYACE